MPVNGFGGGVTIEATNLSTINAINTSTVTASNGQTGPFVSSPGSGLAVNAIIATNNILGSTQAYATSDTIAALGTGGSINVVATSNAAIDAENDASTDAKTTSVGVVLAFNTIGIKQPIAGFLENTIDALFGTALAGQQPDRVYAYMSGTNATASDGIDVSATESSTITAHIGNAETGLFSAGTSVAATVTLNAMATDVEAWIAGGTVTATGGDIDISGHGQSQINSTVVDAGGQAGSRFLDRRPGQRDDNHRRRRYRPQHHRQHARGVRRTGAIGVYLGRHDADGRYRKHRHHGQSERRDFGDRGLGGGRHRGEPERQCRGLRRRRRGRGQHHPRRRHGDQRGLVAEGDRRRHRGVGDLWRLDRRQVAALAASLAASEGAADAVAIGAAVALNLIGWKGTVADETQDSNNPITLSARVSGGSLAARTTVRVTAQSTRPSAPRPPRPRSASR